MLLQPFPASDINNTDKKLRLQLFRPHPRKVKGLESADEAGCVWNWWQKCKHIKYPSSLYVTVQAIDPPTKRRTDDIDDQDIDIHNKSIIEDEKSNQITSNFDVPKVALWTRAPGQSCQVPKTPIVHLPSAGRGVSCLQFTKDGRLLALGCPHPRGAAIFIHEVGNGWPRILTLDGHSGPVYELDWFDHRTLLSASGDGTARVWYLGYGRRRDVLEHPTFVYCAKFHPNSSDIVVTGSYDHVR